MKKYEEILFRTIMMIIIVISAITNLRAQNQEQKEIARFYVTNAKNNGVDITEAVLAGGAFTVFYEIDNMPYMANYFENDNTQSYGRIYNVQYTDYPETTTDYAYDMFRFSWSYSNSYDSKTGTCQCELIKIYKPQGIVSILRMVTESLDVIEYTGYMNGSLNINWQ